MMNDRGCLLSSQCNSLYNDTLYNNVLHADARLVAKEW